MSEQQKDTLESLRETVRITQTQYEEVCNERDRLNDLVANRESTAKWLWNRLDGRHGVTQQEFDDLLRHNSWLVANSS